jgi:hypothetical protein
MEFGALVMPIYDAEHPVALVCSASLLERGGFEPPRPFSLLAAETPRVWPIILRSFSETSDREFIRHHFDTFQTYPVPLSRADVAFRSIAGGNYWQVPRFNLTALEASSPQRPACGSSSAIRWRL